MFRRNLRYLGLVFILILAVSGIVFGAEVKKITLFEAVNFALQQNLDLKIAKLNLDNAQLDYQKSRANNFLLESRFAELQGELSLAQAKENCRQTKNKLVLEIVKEYLQIIQAEQDIKIKEKQLILEKGILAMVKTQVETGYKGKLELLQQQNKYNNALFDLEKAKDDDQQFLREFKTKLGLNQETGLNINVIDKPVRWQVTEAEAIKKTVENSFTIELKKRLVKLTEVDLERAEAAVTPELDLRKIKNNLELARLDYKKVREDLHNSIRNQYYTFKQSRKSLDLRDENLIQAQENNKIVWEQKKAGLKTQNDFLASELSLLQAEYGYQSAITNYELNLLQLQQLMGLEIGVFFDEFSQAK